MYREWLSVFMKRAAAAIFIVLAFALPVSAKDFSAGLILGYAVLTGDAGDVSDDGICFGAYGDYFISPTIALEGTVLYSQHDDVVDDEGSHTYDVFSFLLGPKFTFPMQNMTPYISFGPSLHNLDYKFDPENNPGNPKRDDDTEAGLFLSGGLAFPLGRNLSLSFNLGYQRIFNTDVLDGDIVVSTISLGY